MSYTATQLAHALAIGQTVHARGLPERVLVICLETALTESGLKVYANANNSESLRLPHEAVGSDHASVGIFQQQVPMWGSTADCMDPAKSCTKFLNRLVQHNWESMTNWGAAQAVQVSAYADGSNYQRNDAAARALAAQVWNEVNDVLLTDTVENPNYGHVAGAAENVTVRDVLRASLVTERFAQIELPKLIAAVNARLDAIAKKVGA